MMNNESEKEKAKSDTFACGSGGKISKASHGSAVVSG